ncbi:hypothetical protein BH09BAC2_BH09BAC2_08400 [soil metagenome]
MTFFKFSFVALLLILFTISCKKESFITSPNAQVNISVDTLMFDTVFTSAGSVTKSFKIFNNNNQKLNISKVKLMGGSASAFKINVDGLASPEVNNIEVAANDSVYVFVQVNITPNAANLPFVITDSILVNYNGNDRFVQLQAYGQNANFLRKQKITGNIKWSNTLPYVILGSIQIDAGATLTIDPGTKVYLHADAPFLVDGTLKANGTDQERIIFRGDRLDPDYRDFPAAWPGIYFRNSSINNEISYTNILNAYQAVVVQNRPANSNAKLTLSHTVIDNAYDVGIFGLNTSIIADNCLISNCGQNVVLVIGDYNFTFCTVASYSNYFISHKYPVLQVSNTAETVTAPVNANFTNCIFWGEGGNLNSEINVVLKPSTNNVVFDHVLFKGADPVNATLLSPVKSDPLFDTINITKRIFDFHLQANSPAINKGLVVTLYPLDLDNKPRDANPDLGCYEK